MTVAPLDLEELRLNGCNPLSGATTIRLLHTVDHPHLRNFSVTINNNGGAVHVPPQTPSGAFSNGELLVPGRCVRPAQRHQHGRHPHRRVRRPGVRVLRQPRLDHAEVPRHRSDDPAAVLPLTPGLGGVRAHRAPPDGPRAGPLAVRAVDDGGTGNPGSVPHAPTRSDHVRRPPVPHPARARPATRRHRSLGTCTPSRAGRRSARAFSGTWRGACSRRRRRPRDGGADRNRTRLVV